MIKKKCTALKFANHETPRGVRLWRASSECSPVSMSRPDLSTFFSCLLQGCDTEAGQHHDQHECHLSDPLPVCIEYLKHLVARHAFSRLYGAKADQPPCHREKLMRIDHLKRAGAVKTWMVVTCTSAQSASKFIRYIYINGKIVCSRCVFLPVMASGIICFGRVRV